MVATVVSTSNRRLKVGRKPDSVSTSRKHAARGAGHDLAPGARLGCAFGTTDAPGASRVSARLSGTGGSLPWTPCDSEPMTCSRMSEPAMPAVARIQVRDFAAMPGCLNGPRTMPCYSITRGRGTTALEDLSSTRPNRRSSSSTHVPAMAQASAGSSATPKSAWRCARAIRPISSIFYPEPCPGQTLDGCASCAPRVR